MIFNEQTQESSRNDWVVRRFLDGVRGGIPYANDQLDVMLRLIAAIDRPIERFLDLGSGSGLLAIAVLTRHPNARATLVDNSAPMMEAARDLLGEDTVLPAFVLADLAQPGWTDAIAHEGPFDAIVSGFTINALRNDRKAALGHELLPLLAPGGIFINVEQVASASSWVKEVWDQAMIDSLSGYNERQRTGKSRSMVQREYAQTEATSEELRAPVATQLGWLHDAGFVDVDCYFKYFELAVLGGRRAQ